MPPTTDANVIQLLDSFYRDISTEVPASHRSRNEMPIEKALPMSRKIGLQGGAKIPEETAEMMHELRNLYKSAQERENVMLRLMLRENDPNKELIRCAMHEVVSSEVDVLTQTAGLTADTNNSQNFYYTGLLEEIFQLCQNPNQAELAFLAKMTCSDTQVIHNWFNWKRAAVSKIVVVKWMNKGNTQRGQASRKRQIETELTRAPKRRKPLTAP